MIERRFVAEKVKEFQIQEFISETLRNVGHSHTKLMRTPLGEKIIIFASRPGLIVGRKGENIKKLTAALKKKFNLENPQIEISEVETPSLDARIVAERIASTLERFGIQRFKAVSHKMMDEVMGAGALGIEIILSGKVPSARAKSWRFYSGYLKKCGDIALTGVRVAYATARLKPGIVGIKVKIMPSDIRLPDRIAALKPEEVEEKAEEAAAEQPQPAKEEGKAEKVESKLKETKPRRRAKKKGEAEEAAGK